VSADSPVLPRACTVLPTTAHSVCSPHTAHSNLQAKEATTIDHAASTYTVTCFDESDTELRDVRVHPTHQWKDMQIIITEIYGSPAMFAYDDGTGKDWPVRNQEEWEKFLDILMTEKTCNGEYDVLLLPSNGWSRYNDQQAQEKNNEPCHTHKNGMILLDQT